MTADESVGSADLSVTICPNGPLLVRGNYELRSADGQILTHERSVLALCRCGRSQLKPLCDGSHKAARFADRADAATIAHVLEHARPLPRATADPDAA